MKKILLVLLMFVPVASFAQAAPCPSGQAYYHNGCVPATPTTLHGGSIAIPVPVVVTPPTNPGAANYQATVAVPADPRIAYLNALKQLVALLEQQLANQ